MYIYVYIAPLLSTAEIEEAKYSESRLSTVWGNMASQIVGRFWEKGPYMYRAIWEKTLGNLWACKSLPSNSWTEQSLQHDFSYDQ